ncbi:MAG: shikimate kinase [Planctomycetota bacterium]
MDRAQRIVALIGLRASGKSTIARALAQRLGRAFVDLDDELVRLAESDSIGRGSASAGELLAQLGEPAFRDLEERALARVLDSGVPCVVATGGGVVERASNRERLARDTVCVWLVVSVAELARRMRASSIVRPSLTGRDPTLEIEEIERRRRAWYADLAHLRLECDALPEDAIVRRIEERLAAP